MYPELHDFKYVNAVHRRRIACLLLFFCMQITDPHRICLSVFYKIH